MNGEGEGEESKETTWHDEADGVKGCEHYARNCKLWASCCERYTTCRLCHDAKSRDGHTLDRYTVEKVLCMECGAENSPPSEECGECGIRFATYVCLVCKLYDSTPDKAIYHCDKCGLCRRGQGLGIDFWHCDTCNMCLSTTLENHICIEQNIMSSCAVCREYMFTSTEDLRILPRCGHCLHESCFREYLESSVICPLCSKSIYDMSAEWERFDALIALQAMPPEYAESVSHILCNDCSAYADVPYDFRAHKCPHCGSYNTRVDTVTHPDHIVNSRLQGNDDDNQEQAQDGEQDMVGVTTLSNGNVDIDDNDDEVRNGGGGDGDLEEDEGAVLIVPGSIVVPMDNPEVFREAEDQ